jgi:hypothetical protein
MSWFRCCIEGTNFPGILVNVDKPLGFYTTRFIEADNIEHAELLVLAELKNEKSLQLPPNYQKNSEARVFFKEVVQVNQAEVPEIAQGFAFYEMGT